MYGKIHHLGIAVRNLDEAIKFYRDVLGLKLEKEVNWSSHGLRGAIFPIGETKMELMEVIEPKSEIARSIADDIKIKDGILHHLCFTVDNIEEEIKDLISKGIKMTDEKPQRTKGGKVAWIDKKELEGFMIELVEEGYEIT